MKYTVCYCRSKAMIADYFETNDKGEAFTRFQRLCCFEDMDMVFIDEDGVEIAAYDKHGLE